MLGIDNIIFLSIVVAKLPTDLQAKARIIGLGGALAFRIVLLASLAWIIGLIKPILTVFEFQLSWRDLILSGGGLFLLYKGTLETHEAVESGIKDEAKPQKTMSRGSAICPIMLLDIIFSTESVITAVVIAVITMMVASGPVSRFIQEHPTSKMLALSFLLLIGLALVADGMHFHIPRNYLYFATFFSAVVVTLNLLARKRRQRQRSKFKAISFSLDAARTDVS